MNKVLFLLRNFLKFRNDLYNVNKLLLVDLKIFLKNVFYLIFL